MSAFLEDDVPSAKLMDRDVAKLLFSYLFRYRGAFALAVLLVTVITGSKLIVPYLSSRVIDRSLVKTGLIINLGKRTGSAPSTPSFDRLLTKAKIVGSWTKLDSPQSCLKKRCVLSRNRGCFHRNNGCW